MASTTIAMASAPPCCTLWVLHGVVHVVVHGVHLGVLLGVLLGVALADAVVIDVVGAN